MNKKKFLATCTLVAFGSTMLPAFAFAAKGDMAPATVTLNTTEITVEADKTWLDDGDTIELKSLGSGTVPEYTTAITGSNSEKVTFTLTKPLLTGQYQINIVDKDDPTTNSVQKNFEVKAVEAVEVTSLAKVDSEGKAVNADGSALTAVSLGKISLNGLTSNKVAQNDSVYKLTDVNGLIDVRAEAIYDATADATALDGSLLAAETYYGVATKTAIDAATKATAPKEVFVVKQAEYDKMTQAKKVEFDKVKAIADAIPSSINVPVKADGTGNVLTTIKGLLGKDATGADILGTDKAAVISVSGVLANVMDAAAISNAYDADTDVVTPEDDTADIKLNGLTSATGTVKIAVPVTDAEVAEMYATKTVSVTVGQAPAIDKVRDTYGAANFADYDKDKQTATATFTQKDEGFDFASKMTVLDTDPKTVQYQIKTNSVTGASAFDIAQVFDEKTGKVKALPENDMTLKAILEMKAVDGSAALSSGTTDEITVAFTIKAAGEKPDDVVAAEKAFTEKANSFFKVSSEVQADGKVDKTELPKLNAAYMELLVAYNNYVAASNK